GRAEARAGALATRAAARTHRPRRADIHPPTTQRSRARKLACTPRPCTYRGCARGGAHRGGCRMRALRTLLLVHPCRERLLEFSAALRYEFEVAVARGPEDAWAVLCSR